MLDRIIKEMLKIYILINFKAQKILLYITFDLNCIILDLLEINLGKFKN